MAMTSEAKRALSQTIRKLRARLIEELGEAIEGAYLLSIDAKKASLDEASPVRRARIEGWVAEQVRALQVKGTAAADVVARLRGEIVKDAAATLLQRLVYLRLLAAARLLPVAAAKLLPVAVVTGGWEVRACA